MLEQDSFDKQPRLGTEMPPLDLKTELEKAQTLLKVSREVAGLTTLEEVLTKLVEITARETGADRGSLFLNDEKTGELFTRVAQGIHKREIRLLNTSGIAGHVFTTGEGIIALDAYAHEKFDKIADVRTGYKTDSVLCAPIRTVNGEIIGVVQALNKVDGEFTQEDLETLEALATQAAIALQSRQTIERMTASRKTEMEFLDIVSSVTSEIDLSVLLGKVMGEATRMLDADRSTLFLNNEKTNELWSEVGKGLESFQIKLPNTAGIAGAVFQSGQTINIPHAYADLRFNPAFDKKTGYFTRSILCVPVINKNNKVIGVTQVLNKRGGPFTGEDESRLRAFTAQVSISLENAQLFEDVHNMKNYNESILNSMSNGVITLDSDGVIKTCNSAGFKILGIEESEVVDIKAEEFFTDGIAWIYEKMKVAAETGEADIFIDAEIEFNKRKLSVNLTMLPLKNQNKKQMGSMLMFEDISSEKRMKSTMSKYVDASLAETIMGDEENILGGKAEIATVLFSDIRGFTSLTEKLGAQGTVKLLNEYFTLMVDCIEAERGVLDKFIGDAIMAVFGIPLVGVDDEDRALRCAIDMLRVLREHNAVRTAKGQLPVEIGIGLNTDMIVSGNIGSPKRMNYTAIGDGVNLAARLESACKQYSAQLLISEYTYAKLKGTYRVRDIDKVIVKGKTEPVEVYEVLDYHTEESFPNIMEVVSHFNAGIQLYRKQDWDKALHQFDEALTFNRKDSLSQIYIDRTNLMKANPPGDEWDGVWMMTDK
jgi:adenylate cyclase